MQTIDVTVVRIYTVEGSVLLKTVLHYLQNEANVRGVSIFRAIKGFGESGQHAASLLDLSVSLPLVIEFFDHPDKITQILEHLETMVKPEHILFFSAKANA